MKDHYEIIIKKDGDMWCAHSKDFINLQESDAGFGQYPHEAVQEYFGLLE